MTRLAALPVLLGLLSLAGTLVGTLGGILAANKLTMYRIEQLEKKVDKHNSVVERVSVLERDSKTAFRLIDGMRAAGKGVPGPQSSGK